MSTPSPTPPTWTAPPPDLPNQSFLTVSIIPAGYLDLFEEDFFADQAGNQSTRSVPSLAFLLRNDTTGENVMFDLGLRKVRWGGETCGDGMRVNLKVEKDAADVLRTGDVKPEDVQKIVFSHLHWDHVGDVSSFPQAHLYIGPGASPRLKPNFPFPSHPSPITELTIPPSPFGAFTHSLDLFSNGTLYILDAPGHFPGHIVAAARVGPGTFVLLGGDCCHCRESYTTSVRQIPECNHEDVVVARETLGRVREHGKRGWCALLAHETERLGECPIYPEVLREFSAVNLA
ncbi:beta-lactamase-like protein [Fimicolochytrium jonesii]|uniref:beta-lactamase-like protein n=1 Tax=Fimicolochytrium jonesii TaxID=1396493 RepID=UPI0022FDF0FA|nr:beta-lactamase-like protein [Fimicolochytrium jonesii]KAI8823450.1 beta-lactamase-like protein [Fimicolochytrium jonesii]